MGDKGDDEVVVDSDPRYTEALQKQSALAERQQDWYLNTIYPWVKQTVEESGQLADENREKALQDYEWWKNFASTSFESQSAKAQEYYDRWKSSYLPVEQQLISSAYKYLDDTYQSEQAQLAGGLVQQQYGIQTQANQMNMAQYGVDTTLAPNYTSYNRAQSLQQQAASAAAANQARDAAQEAGWDKLTQLSALGQGYLSASNSAQSVATSTAATGQSVANSAQQQSQTLSNQQTANVSNFNNIGLQSYQTLQNAWGQYGQQGLQATQNAYNVAAAEQQAKAQKAGSIVSGIATVGTAVAMAF